MSGWREKYLAATLSERAQFWRNLLDLFDEACLDSPEEANAYLREQGYDPEEVARTIRATVDRAIAERRKSHESGRH